MILTLLKYNIWVASSYIRMQIFGNKPIRQSQILATTNIFRNGNFGYQVSTNQVDLATKL
jgi:hypothetical protein